MWLPLKLIRRNTSIMKHFQKKIQRSIFPCVLHQPISWCMMWIDTLYNGMSRVKALYLTKWIQNTRLKNLTSSDQIRSVTQSCPTLCDPMNRSTPGLPVHHQLPEFTQTHLILCHHLLLLPPIHPSIRVFSNESTLRMRWPKYWSSALASFLPKKSQGWSPSEWTCWISLQSKGLSRVFSNTTVQKNQFFGAQPSSQSNSHIHTWPQEKP